MPTNPFIMFSSFLQKKVRLANYIKTAKNMSTEWFNQVRDRLKISLLILSEFKRIN